MTMMVAVIRMIGTTRHSIGRIRIIWRTRTVTIIRLLIKQTIEKLGDTVSKITEKAAKIVEKVTQRWKNRGIAISKGTAIQAKIARIKLIVVAVP